VPKLTFVTLATLHNPEVTSSDFGGTTRLAGMEGSVWVAVTKPWVSIEGSNLEANSRVWKLAKDNKVTPPAMAAIPAVTIGDAWCERGNGSQHLRQNLSWCRRHFMYA